ncbi:MAG: hypothetical protein H6536_02800 [Bacteroidales bacterium]|nr:hypothetical protein [Bacteroidales bacterium]
MPQSYSQFKWYAPQIGLKIQISQKRKSNGHRSSRQYSKGHKSAGPLLQTTWNQEPYYNSISQARNWLHVATTMSQIMKYQMAV